MTGPADTGGDATVSYRLMLFVAGDEKNSRLARKNLQSLCDTELGSDCKVEIVDVMEDFGSALKHNILLTPALLVLAPPPKSLIIGSLSDMTKVRRALGLGRDRKTA
jgi:circadian clock protein KaiB